jgi:hypothetical protein
MSEAEVARLRRDLDTMQSAAGLVLPFGWREVWLTLALAPCGAIVAAWALLGPPGYLTISLLPLAAAFLTYFGSWSLRYRAHAREQREHRFETIAAAAFLVAMACLFAWDRMFHLPRGAVLSGGFILAGIMLVPLALSSPARRPGLAYPFTLIPAGLALPFCTRQQTFLVLGLGLMATGLLAAAIMARQLKANPPDHD